MGFINTFQRMSVDELRSEAIGLLKQAYADGRITVDTLERRLREATKADEKETLIGLVADIPGPENEDTGRARNERTWLENTRVPRENEMFFAILGGSTRTGRWQPARSITCLSALGGVKLDFREAEFPRGGVRLHALCVMGGLEITVPPGVNVDLTGIPLLGGLDNKSGEGTYGAPTLSVRGLCIMGGIEVRRREPKSPRGARGPEDEGRRRKRRR